MSYVKRVVQHDKLPLTQGLDHVRPLLVEPTQSAKHKAIPKQKHNIYGQMLGQGLDEWLSNLSKKNVETWCPKTSGCILLHWSSAMK